MPLHEIDRMDAASLAGAMRRRELSPVEVTARSLERLEETASALNAFAAVDRPYAATDDWRTLGGTSTFSSYGAGGFATGAGVVQAVTGNLPGLSSPSQYAVIPTGATGSATLPASAYTPTTVSAETGDRAKYVNLISPQFTRTILQYP